MNISNHVDRPVTRREGGEPSHLENFGENIYLPYDQDRLDEYGHVTSQGIPKVVNQISLRASYLIYPHNNMRVFAGFRQRWQSLNREETSGNFIEFGLTSALFNRYTDI